MEYSKAATAEKIVREQETDRPSGLRMAAYLFVQFIKIGAFTFGSGWSILAQIEQEFVDRRKWITKSDLMELIAVGKSLPGIMVANITLLFGYQLAFAALRGVQCAVVPIIGSAAISLGKETLKSKMAIVLCIGAFCVCAFTGISNLTLVICGVIASLIWMGVKEHGLA